MVVSEGAINNIMGGMENTAGVRLHSHRHKLKQRFDIIRKLGQGTYGKVQLAVNKETGQEVAIKTIKKAKIETEQDLIRIRREIQIMSSVQHPQIIHIYEVFENREKMVLVMEYAAGGELYDYLSERKVLSEDEARRVFRHVASATYYCHKHKICHRDLKLENILLDLDGNAKIADFGLSNVFDEKHRLDTFCGSPLYASPEIVKGIPYTGPEVDCWSLGVLLYTLVYGAMPFDGSNFKRLVKQITLGDYYEPKKPSRASDLIRRMLTVSATKRATIEDICTHWWVNEGYLESCLDVAEALANQTPVRLDLLLSLAPKHINSEHMLIQPDEDESMRSPPTSEATRPPPQLHLPPPPPDTVPVVPTRSVSLGAITSTNHNDIEAYVTKKLKEKKKDDEKKRKADQSGEMDKKKKRDSTVEGTPKPSRKEPKADGSAHEGESGERRKISTKKKEQIVDGETSEQDKSDRSDRKKSVKKQDPDGDISDLSDVAERRKSVKKRETSVDKEVNESDRAEKKKSVKKRETSATRQSNDDKVDRRKSTKKKEALKEDGGSVSANSESVTETVINGEKLTTKPKDAPIGTSEDQLPGLSLKPPLPKDQIVGKSSSSDLKTRKSSSGKTELGNAYQTNDQIESMEVEDAQVSSPVSPGSSTKLSASMRSVGSSASNDCTLKASDSSLSRESISPMKVDGGSSTKLSGSKTKSPSPSHGSQVRKVKSKSLVKTLSKGKVEDKPSDVPVVNGESVSPISPDGGKLDDTEKILQETADKIKRAEESNIPVIVKTEESRVSETSREDLTKEGEMAGEQRQKEGELSPDSSKDGSQASSLLSTPARSRAGSESSNEARPTRTDSVKRQSKIFKAAAMWENQTAQQPPTGDKTKKSARPPPSAMTDLTKKFEEKQTAERKTKLVPSLKVSDAKKAFESKSTEKPSVIYRKKSLSDSLPTSPTTKECPQLPTTQSGPTISMDAAREMTPVSTVSKIKERSPSKDKSPVKEPAKEKSVPRDVEKEKSPKKVKELGTKTSVKSKVPKAPISDGKDSTATSQKLDNKPEETKKTLVSDKPHVGKDEKLVKPKTTTHTLEVSPREPVTSSEEEAVVVGGLNLKLEGVGKISEVGTKQEVRKVESSDSSDSESEAEKLLKLLSEKREKVEAARREKLRKVSEAKDREAKKDMPAIREEPQSKSPSKSPPTSPEKVEKPTTSESLHEQKYATLPRGFKSKQPQSVPAAAAAATGLNTPPQPKLKKNNINQEIEGMMSAIKAVDQAITKEPADTQIAKDANRKKSQVEIQLTSPTAKDAPKPQEFISEVHHSVESPPRGLGESQLQRAKRERIIPIMLEDEDDDDDHTTSEGLPRSERPITTSSSMGSHVTQQIPHQPPISRAPLYNTSPETIMKSRRERIIPIAVEGEGIVTPPPHVEEAAELGAARAHQAFTRTLANRPNPLNRGRGFHLDHSESFSSAGEEEEEDEDDGFQILTAESLFSTLLNRVRSLTRKMNADEIRSERLRGPSHHPTPEPNAAPGSAGIGAGHSSSSGFWSSLYNSPRDSPSRRISETMSRSSLGRDDDTLGGLSSPLWTRSVSRDTSDADTLFSEASTPFSTLPRGWRSRWSGAEDGGESDTSEASGRSLGRRPQYSRVSSRELHNIPDEEMGYLGGHAYPGGGMSLPRPYPGNNAGGMAQNRGSHDSADRIAAMYGTMRHPHRRPHSTVVPPQGEGIGRDGGLCEQQFQKSMMPFDASAYPGVKQQQQQRTSQLSPSGQLPHSPEETAALKQSVQEQLQQLVRELEAGENPPPDVPLIPEQPPGYPQYENFPLPSSTTLPTSTMAANPSNPQITATQAASGTMSTNFSTAQKTNLDPAAGSSLSNQVPPKSDGQSSLYGNQSAQHTRQSNQTVTIPTSIPVCYTNTSSSVSTVTTSQSNLALREPSNRGAMLRCSGNDQVGYNAILDISREDAGSPQSSDGIPEGGARKTGAINDEWLRSGGPVVRSAETTALEAYRRSRGKSNANEYNRGKSEDLRHTIDSLARLEATNINEGSVSSPSANAAASQDIQNIPTAGSTQATTNELNSGEQQNLSAGSFAEVNKNAVNANLPANTIPRVSGIISSSSTNNDQNNNGGIMISRSTSGIPLKSNSPSNISSRSSYSGTSTSSTNLKSATDLLQPKSYKRSKSRELQPAIEAAGERFSQLNSSTLKRISPFEAYRRTKSKELPVEAANKDSASPSARLKSPPPAPERAKSPFERARASIERQFERAKSPLSERAANRKSETPAGLTGAPPTPNLNRAPSMGREQVNAESNLYREQMLKKQEMSEHESSSTKYADKEKESEKRDKDHVKKTSSCDPEKPKSMYKLLASRFNRSGSNVPENSKTEKRPDEDDTSERDEKFKLKRPSRFMKSKTEKSSSKTSICDGESSQESSERVGMDRKPSKKLTDALNKFLGRKDSKEEHKPSTGSSPQLTVAISEETDDQPLKPPRVKPKKFSKSQENLSRVEETGEVMQGVSQANRTQSVALLKDKARLQPGFTLESVTKSICDHLSQLESDISSRIGNMNIQDSGTHVVTSNGTRQLPTASSVPALTNYGLSPGLASRRNARPTNLDIAAATRDIGPPSSTAPTKAASLNASPSVESAFENEEVRIAQIKRLGIPSDGVHTEDGSQTPTESGESTTSGADDMKGYAGSENDDESVMDRITRKSYYSRFQEIKKKPKLRRANTKEDMDQQLAAAKARLMKEETQKTVRDSLSPLRFSGTSPATSPRASVTSPPSWDPLRKHSRKSLPPEDLTSTYLMGGRRGTSLQPDDFIIQKRHSSVQPDKHIGRLPSVPPDDRSYKRAPSVPLDSLSSNRRLSKSIPSGNAISLPTSPITTCRENADEERVQNVVAAAAAAGALAGEAAAEEAADGVKDQRRSKSREPSLSRLRSPEPVKLQTSAQEETRNMAREELSRRLTHLTRISGTSGLSNMNRGGKGGMPPGNAGDRGGMRPYIRANTAGRLGEPSPGFSAPGAGAIERPVYRRTNTMDLPPADARARPGSEYRRLMQDPSRRYSAASMGRYGDKGRHILHETLMEEDTSPIRHSSTHFNSSSPQSTSHHSSPSTSSHHSSPSTSSHLSSPSTSLGSSSASTSTPSSYRIGYSAVDSLSRYTPSVLDTARHYSSSMSPISRRLSFYRY